jgi:hypothetical protein
VSLLPPRWTRLRVRPPIGACAAHNATAMKADGLALLEWELWPSWEWGLERGACQLKTCLLVIIGLAFGACGYGRCAANILRHLFRDC